MVIEGTENESTHSAECECDFCGKTFFRELRLLRWKRSIGQTLTFCNRYCSGKYRTGERNGRYLHGRCITSGKPRHKGRLFGELNHMYIDGRSKDPEHVKKLKAMSKRRWKIKNRQKYLAQKAVYRAVKNGTLIRKPCIICGDIAEAHHWDYNKPLDVDWLCGKHHRMLHDHIGTC